MPGADGYRLRGHTETIGERMQRVLGALLALPATPYDASDKHATRVSSQLLVRYRTNDYSVPVVFGHRDVLVRGYVDEVVISCGTEVIARHRRSYEHGDFVFDPMHCLPLLEQKTGALDQTAPLAGWDLPEESAVRAAVERGATGYDAVKRLLLRRIEGRPPGLELDLDPHLPSVSVSTTMLLEHHLKELKLPTFLREYGKIAAQCASEGVDHPDYLLRLSELELIDRHHRLVACRIKAARFPAVKSLDTFDFPAIPSVNRQLVTQLVRCEYIESRENVIAIGNSGTSKTHIALGLGLAACQKGLTVGFATASALVNELMEARDEMRLLNL